MLRIIKFRVIVPPLAVIFPADFLGRELVCLFFPSAEHFQQFGGIRSFVLFAKLDIIAYRCGLVAYTYQNFPYSDKK